MMTEHGQLERARRNAARNLGIKPSPRKERMQIEIMEGKWDNTPAVRSELVKLWLEEQPS